MTAKAGKTCAAMVSKRYNTRVPDFRFAFALVLLAPLACAQTNSPLQRRLVGDYGYWSRTQVPPYSSAQIPFNELTHLNHAGVSFGADGSLTVPSGFLEPELLSKGHAAGVKVLLLLGGDFTALDGNPAVLTTLLQNLSVFITENGYDGLDIDWEYPASTADIDTFGILMNGLRATFPSPQYTLSADVPPWGGSYAHASVQPIIDYFNIMMYDCAGPWTDDGQLNSAIFPDPNNPEPYECAPGGSVLAAADIFLEALKIPPAQLNMGTPFYGYFYANVSSLFGPCVNCAYTVPSENYGTWIKQRINKLGWQSYVDQNSAVPYMLRADGSPGYITYDDPVSTYHRINYSLWQRGLGGSFMWSLDADYDGHSQDLLDAMYSATLGGKAPLAQ
jgi:chitinase